MSTTSRKRSQAPSRPMACSYCRLKKIRCSGTHPCANCFDRGEDCVYPAPQRTKSVRRPNKALEERLARMETLMDATNLENVRKRDQGRTYCGQPREPGHTLPPQVDMESGRIEDISVAPHLSQSKSRIAVDLDATSRRQLESTDNEFSRNTAIVELSYPSTQMEPASSPGLDSYFKMRPNATFAHATTDALGSIADQENPDWEYHGPSSFLSICSIPALEWVTKRTGESSFVGSARTLALSVTKRLKLQRNLGWTRAPEPDPETAWKYCEAYFEHSFDAVLGVVDRPTFESRLHSYLERKTTSHDDLAWFALRYTVYASGCRIILSKLSPSTPFAEAQERAWQFFENALSVHTELLYCTTSLLAVQALAAMSLFVECLGSPALDYMLCSCAVRLAQSKGLHRQPALAWNLSEAEIQHRNLLFWVIYTSEKHLAYKSGRPSVIDDDDISCQIPMSVPQGSTVNLDCLTYIIKHAQISSLISKRLATVKAFRQTPKQITESVCELDMQLQQWRESLPPFLQPVGPIKLNELPRGVHLYHVMYIRYAYFGSVMAIHSIFTYPWNSAVFGTSQTPLLRNQISLSTNIVVEAARSIILDTKYIDINASSPIWLALFTPLVGLINLFIYVLKYPTLPTANSDIALIDVAVGHFGRLEFALSDLAFPFTRDVASLARDLVRKTREGFPSGDATSPPSDSLTEPAVMDATFDSVDDLESGEMIDFYMEDWSTMLPLFVQGPSAGSNNQLMDENVPNFF